VRRSSVSRVREIRTHGLKGGLRKRGEFSPTATAPEVYQWCVLKGCPPVAGIPAVSDLRVKVPSR